MAALALLPVHAIYAGFELRESLVALMSILAVWALTEVCSATPESRAIWGWALVGGPLRRVGHHGARRGLPFWLAEDCSASSPAGGSERHPLLLWALTAAVVCLPWAIATWLEYGTPFYSMTRYFEYNFSWTVHHYMRGNTSALGVLHLAKHAGDLSGKGEVACS